VPPAREVVDARKQRFGRDEALALARQAERVVVAKGKQTVVFDMKGSPDEDLLAALLLGPTGNLKAPALRVGGTLYVGFSDEAYRELLG
jgi:hypothetical protein